MTKQRWVFAHCRWISVHLPVALDPERLRWGTLRSWDRYQSIHWDTRFVQSEHLGWKQRSRAILPMVSFPSRFTYKVHQRVQLQWWRWYGEQEVSTTSLEMKKWKIRSRRKTSGLVDRQGDFRSFYCSLCASNQFQDTHSSSISTLSFSSGLYPNIEQLSLSSVRILLSTHSSSFARIVDLHRWTSFDRILQRTTEREREWVIDTRSFQLTAAEDFAVSSSLAGGSPSSVVTWSWLTDFWTLAGCCCCCCCLPALALWDFGWFVARFYWEKGKSKENHSVDLTGSCWVER